MGFLYAMYAMYLLCTPYSIHPWTLGTQAFRVHLIVLDTLHGVDHILSCVLDGVIRRYLRYQVILGTDGLYSIRA